MTDWLVVAVDVLLSVTVWVTTNVPPPGNAKVGFASVDAPTPPKSHAQPTIEPSGSIASEVKLQSWRSQAIEKSAVGSRLNGSATAAVDAVAAPESITVSATSKLPVAR